MEDLVKSNGFSDFRARSLCYGVASIYTVQELIDLQIDILSV